MLPFLDGLRDINFFSVLVRMLAAVFCSAVIGLERSIKNRPAGFRTHILVCVGAATASLTGHYLYLVTRPPTDMTRIGAQVITGLGFIGAGTIIVTRRNQIKGLTTAAGLWTCAIVGLAIGAGFYEGGLIATALVLLSELVISNLEYTFMRRHPEINVYLEFRSRSVLETVFDGLKKDNVKVRNLEITRTKEKDVMNSSAIFTLRFQKAVPAEEVLASIRAVDGVYLVEEL